MSDEEVDFLLVEYERLGFDFETDSRFIYVSYPKEYRDMPLFDAMRAHKADFVRRVCVRQLRREWGLDAVPD